MVKRWRSPSDIASLLTKESLAYWAMDDCAGLKQDQAFIYILNLLV